MICRQPFPHQTALATFWARPVVLWQAVRGFVQTQAQGGRDGRDPFMYVVFKSMGIMV